MGVGLFFQELNFEIFMTPKTIAFEEIELTALLAFLGEMTKDSSHGYQDSRID